MPVDSNISTHILDRLAAFCFKNQLQIRSGKLIYSSESTVPSEGTGFQEPRSNKGTYNSQDDV